MDLELSNFQEGVLNPGTSLPDLGWDVLYEANEMPDAATPVWTKEYGPATTEEIDPAGFLHIDSSDQYLGYSTVDTDFDNSVGTTIAFRLKLIAGYDKDSWAGYPEISIDDGTRAVSIDIATDQIYVGGGGANETCNMDTTDDYHIYHFTLKGNDYKLYIDGVLKCFNPSWSSVGGTQKIEFWPDYGGVAGVETSWDYFYYSTGGAFVP